ncbi:protein of unknown function [Mesotoga infera]|uniref:Uncharacterized protein n=1 Tax=Mesotoga infera TaxID=1236046 RepID=A0A7Z7LFE1_9BACT|nr:protein of unknown function [Mesotoga infera]
MCVPSLYTLKLSSEKIDCIILRRLDLGGTHERIHTADTFYRGPDNPTKPYIHRSQPG